MPAMLWPVYGFSGYFRREYLATFFDRSDAVDFALHPERYGAEKRSLYIAAPQYDTRQRRAA